MRGYESVRLTLPLMMDYQRCISIVCRVLIFFLMNKWDFAQLSSLMLSSNFLCA